ncbi:MAG: S8/S53 family peptidase [Verrucomicrobia bacterium]|nr:S8/S53 family peptidase [Verrucomicrobiota bacterium]
MGSLTFLKSRSPRECFKPAVVAVLPVIFAILLQLPAQASLSDQDLGPTNGTQIVTASLVLNVRNLDALESFVASTQDRNSRFYHQFLSLPEFVRKFAPDSAQIVAITQYLNSFGIQATEVYANNLLIRTTGSVDAFNKAFAFSIHDFSKTGERFHRPLQEATIPASLKDAVLAVVGPSDEAHFISHKLSRNDFAGLPLGKPNLLVPPKGATGVPGQYNVFDFAKFYDINPLYDAGINGSGRTIGIATLAAFHPSDAYSYWNLVGLQVDQHRIQVVKVDGGGKLSAKAGSDETSLDVEQSGGVAPGANIIVYDAPNSNAGFIDLFYKAASDNLVDSLSTSWGESEVYYFKAVGGVNHIGLLRAFHSVFLELAAQGISTFASAGDSGAYDANVKYNDPFNNFLSVDYPASDPAIAAAGGTTLPITLTPSEIVSGVTNPPNVPPLVVSTQQVWGWDYLQNYMVKYVGPKYENFFFPGGGGGGVSIFWSLPGYQQQTTGIRQSEPGQSVIYKDQVLLNLPANFPGRNLPDVALNADPYSGYVVVSSVLGGVSDGWGGTSFVAPQLNGISALVSQAIGGRRIGLWNPMLYRFQQVYGYGKVSPFIDITHGDNWFYYGVPGYEPGAGLGALDVTKLALAVFFGE